MRSKQEFKVLLETQDRFSKRTMIWVKHIFNSGTSKVLLSGVPRKTFYRKRGVRQGDPLSPLLFVLAADFLQTFHNKAKDDGLVNLPITQ